MEQEIGMGAVVGTGFPHFRTDKIPLYFHDFSKCFKNIPGIFSEFFNVASNYFWVNVYIKISPNQKYIISTVSQGSHISGLTKFHDFYYFLQNSMIFPGFPGVLYFSRFSSKCGNPVGMSHNVNARSFLTIILLFHGQVSKEMNAELLYTCCNLMSKSPTSTVHHYAYLERR